MQLLNYYVVHKEFYEHILDEQDPHNDILQISHVPLIPIDKKTIREK